MSDAATSPTEPPANPTDSAIQGVTALMGTATDAVAMCRRLQADNDRLRAVAGAATALCVALDKIPLGMNPGPRAAVVVAVAARIVLVEKLAAVSR